MLRRGFDLASIPLLAWLSILAIQIAAAGVSTPETKADVAIVLGARVENGYPSPVFEERIRHAASLYRSGRVRSLIMTGGFADGEDAEALVGRRRAIALGVPASAILVETRSHTTFGNLTEARAVLRASNVSALIVSDPLHMKRAIRMATDLGMTATGEPTPTTRYRSWSAKAGFLVREMFFYNIYLISTR